MNRADIPFLSVAELSQLIERKEVSPVEATEAYLDRIEDLDFMFNSYLTVCRKEALKAAGEAEQTILQGGYRGPMHGVPFAVKDQLWTKGIRTTGGSRILMDFVPEEDSTPIAKLKEAGAVLLGKLNMTEFAVTGFTHRFSTPRNPWNLEISAGGSSSGSGAATAAFLCATSLGEDTGGSIRRPAAWCSLVGVRPSWGRVSRYGLLGGVWSMDTVGPVSRTVEDAAITLGTIAGHDPRDPHTWNTPVPDYRAGLNGEVKGMRIGVVQELVNNDHTTPEVRGAVVKAASVLGELGASVEDVSIPLTAHANAIFAPLLAVEPAMSHRKWIRERLQDYGHDNRIGLLTGSIIPAQVYYKAERLRSMIRDQVLEAMEKYDVLLAPTGGRVAPPLQDDPPITSKQEVGRLKTMFAATFNLANAPALSVPCGFSSEGLPIGLQVGARPGEDGVMLKVAHAYEQATPWHTMKPPTV